MTCAFDDGAFDSIAFDVCVPSVVRIGAGFSPSYVYVPDLGKIKRRRDDEEILILS